MYILIVCTLLSNKQLKKKGMKKELQKAIKRRKRHMPCKVIRYKVKMRKAKMKSEFRP